MTIEITALDTLFFRDGKPFTMGDDTWATGVFPPSPSVFYGMLRTTYAAQKGINLSEIENDTKNLKISSILLLIDDEPIFPYPADVYSTSEFAKDSKAKNLTLMENSTISKISTGNCPQLLSTQSADKVKEYFGKAFFGDITFDEYLSGKTEHRYITIDDYLQSEAKIGIGKDLKTNTTSEGKLYRIGMKRPEWFDSGKDITKKIRFAVSFEGLEIEENGFLKLGAESKFAEYKTIDTFNVGIPKINKNIKIYLATPALFSKCELPDFIIKRNYERIDFRLLTYAIGKPIHIGGFDMKRREPKPLKKAVPAGSVYYLQSENAVELAKMLHGKSISEELAEQGFGICYCGTF